MNSRTRQFNGSGPTSSSAAASTNSADSVTPEDLRKFQALLDEAHVQLDNEALMVIANLLRLNVSPDEICAVLKQIMPVCGILKRFKLKPKPSAEQ